MIVINIRCSGSLCKAPPEIARIPVLRFVGGRDISRQDGAGAVMLRPLASILSGAANNADDVGCHQLGKPDGMGIYGGEAASPIPRMLGIYCTGVGENT